MFIPYARKRRFDELMYLEIITVPANLESWMVRFAVKVPGLNNTTRALKELVFPPIVGNKLDDNAIGEYKFSVKNFPTMNFPSVKFQTVYFCAYVYMYK